MNPVVFFWWVQCGKQGDLREFECIQDAAKYLYSLGIRDVQPARDLNGNVIAISDKYTSANSISFYRGDDRAAPTPHSPEFAITSLNAFLSKCGEVPSDEIQST